jgi:hypothetical protein
MHPGVLQWSSAFEHPAVVAMHGAWHEGWKAGGTAAWAVCHVMCVRICCMHLVLQRLRGMFVALKYQAEPNKPWILAHGFPTTFGTLGRHNCSWPATGGTVRALHGR